MNKKDLFKWNAIIFGLVVLFHGLRLIFGWNLTISQWLAPNIVSVLAVVLAGWLCWENWHAK